MIAIHTYMSQPVKRDLVYCRHVQFRFFNTGDLQISWFPFDILGPPPQRPCTVSIIILVLVCGNPGACGQRVPRQQEEAHHTSSHPARHTQRRGAKQAPTRRDHRRGRCSPQHTRGAAAQKARQESKRRRVERYLYQRR